MSKFKVLCTGSIAALLLSGCSEYSIRELDSAPRMGYEFSRNLADEYSKYAKDENSEYDHINAAHFAVKGTMAAAGEEVLPEDPRRWDVPADGMQGLLDARERLIFALTKSGRRVAPKLSAEAQVAYDCYIEELEEGSQAGDIATCETLFKDRLVALEKAVEAVAPTFMVYFEFNSPALTADAKKVLAEVAKTAKNMNFHTIDITGNTDGIGGRKHNLLLSQARAMNVRDELVKNGIDNRKIIAVGGGEENGPEVQPRNRRVDVNIH